MKALTLTVLLTGLVASAVASRGDAVKNDKSKLQGTWRLTAIEGDGKKAPADYVKHFTYTFKGDNVHFLGDVTTPGADLEFTYTLDPTKSPKQIDMKLVKSSDMKDLGEVNKGIYELKGDTLRICAGPGGRPTDFTTKKGAKQTLVILKREKK